jgi:hypothetical protein
MAEEAVWWARVELVCERRDEDINGRHIATEARGISATTVNLHGDIVLGGAPNLRRVEMRHRTSVYGEVHRDSASTLDRRPPRHGPT